MTGESTRNKQRSSAMKPGGHPQKSAEPIFSRSKDYYWRSEHPGTLGRGVDPGAWREHRAADGASVRHHLLLGLPPILSKGMLATLGGRGQENVKTRGLKDLGSRAGDEGQ